MRYRIILSALILSAVGCSEGEPDAAMAEAPAEEVAAETECRMPDGLLARFALHRQLVLNLAQTDGRNRESVEGMGVPEPGTFRSVADVLDDQDLSNVAPSTTFDAPEELVRDLRRTADLLEAALATSGEGADPAWTALAEFYTQQFYVHHNASIGYYLSEAGCV